MQMNGTITEKVPSDTGDHRLKQGQNLRKTFFFPNLSGEQQIVSVIRL